MSSSDDEDELALIEGLSYEARVAFIAFCVERCLAEASKHAVPRAQLEQLPLLAEGVDMLWAVAQGGPEPDPERIQVIIEHIDTYQRELPGGEGMSYTRDVTLVFAACALWLGMRVLLDPNEADADFVAGAIDGPGRMVGTIYRRASDRDQEEALLQVALQRLRAAGGKSITPTMFDGISEWQRGPLEKRYAAGQITTDSLDEDE